MVLQRHCVSEPEKNGTSCRGNTDIKTSGIVLVVPAIVGAEGPVNRIAALTISGF